MTKGPDDHSLAKYLVKAMNGDYAWFYGFWHAYEGGVWRAKHDVEMRAYCRAALVQARKKGFDMPIGDMTLNRVLNVAKTDLFVKDELVNARQNYLNMQNGLLNLDTGRLEDHRRDVYLTRQVDYPYDAAAKCPTFKTFLETSLAHEDGSDDQFSTYLAWEAIAYTLSPLTNRKTAFFLIGPGDSGKSTLISVVASLLGELARPFDFKVLQSESAYRFALYPLIGARMIYATEIEAGATIPDGIFKTLTGGDVISADVKNRAPIQYKPEFKMWMATNNLPSIGDRSGATMNRISMLVFPRSFSRDQQDQSLAAKLLSERPGILNRALEVWLYTRHKQAFTVPARSQQRLQDYRMANDPEALFVAECCAPGGTTEAKTLRDVYYAWRKRNGYSISKPWPKVVSDLQRLGIDRKRTPPGNLYLTNLTRDGWSYIE